MSDNQRGGFNSEHQGPKKGVGRIIPSESVIPLPHRTWRCHGY